MDQDEKILLTRLADAADRMVTALEGGAKPAAAKPRPSRKSADKPASTA